MGYFVAYVLDDQDEPIDGDHVASGTGWDAWGGWAEGLDESDFPATVRLAEEGEGYPPAVLQEELRQLVDDPPGEPSQDVRHVTQALLDRLGEMPKDTVAIIVTDGEAGAADDDDDESA
jgi:hypothetical protein